ncbi:4558_t:CDS:2, partial [Acaulospora colombiana]
DGHTGHFRLRNVECNTLVYSSTKHLGHYPSSDEAENQFFAFSFDGMEIVRIDYHLDKAKLMDTSKPLVVAEQRLDNPSSAEQSMSFAVSNTQEHTSSFEYTAGFSVTVGTSGKIALPFVAEGEISVEASTSHEWTWGTEIKTSIMHSATFNVTAPPKKSVKATAKVSTGTMDVPFTMHVKVKSTGFTTETQVLASRRL